MGWEKSLSERMLLAGMVAGRRKVVRAIFELCLRPSANPYVFDTDSPTTTLDVSLKKSSPEPDPTTKCGFDSKGVLKLRCAAR